MQIHPDTSYKVGHFEWQLSFTLTSRTLHKCEWSVGAKVSLMKPESYDCRRRFFLLLGIVQAILAKAQGGERRNILQ